MRGVRGVRVSLEGREAGWGLSARIRLQVLALPMRLLLRLPPLDFFLQASKVVVFVELRRMVGWQDEWMGYTRGGEMRAAGRVMLC